MRRRGKRARPSNPLANEPYDKSAGSETTDTRGDSRPAAPRLRYDRPGPARHIARVVLKHAMDYEAAIREITFGWGLSELSVAEYAEKCEQAPLVQQGIQEEMKQAGLGEDFKAEFLTLMRSWLYTGTADEKLKAATIFGKGFVGEKVTSDKPVPLPIAGLAEGMKRMLAEDVVEATEPVAADESAAEQETIQ